MLQCFTSAVAVGNAEVNRGVCDAAARSSSSAIPVMDFHGSGMMFARVTQTASGVEQETIYV